MMEAPDFATMILLIGDLWFDFWFIFVLGSIMWRSGQRFKAMLAFWFLFALARVALLFGPEPMEGSFMLPEPQNTQIFVLAGIGLTALFLLQRRRSRLRIHRTMGQVRSIHDLLDLSPTEFENTIVELYNLAGHQAKRTGRVGDRGVDVVVRAKNGEKWIIQCKRWKNRVGQPLVREFYGAMQHEKADRGAIFAVGGFTKPAVQWAQGKPITLYDGQKFVRAWRKTDSQRRKAERQQKRNLQLPEAATPSAPE